GHESSMIAARLSEIAASKDKYWAYTDTVFDPSNTERIKDKDGVGLKQIITGLGIDAKYVQDCLDDDHDKSVIAVASDIGIATRSLGLTGTPSFIVMATATPTRKIDANQLEAMLSEEPYKSLLGK
ncbi:MAG: hypothetical protein ABUL72_04660, partial [Armatimonadota bacterium]